MNLSRKPCNTRHVGCPEKDLARRHDGWLHARRYVVLQTSYFLLVANTLTAPVLEIGKILHSRGHTIEFATLDSQEKWTAGYEFISKVHLLGPGPTVRQLDDHYLRMRDWDMSQGLAKSLLSKYMFDSFWPQTYRGLKALMDTLESADRPRMIVADFFAEAVRDIQYQYKIPVAMVNPQMPPLMMPCSYIPGEPGFQIEGTTTSEHASLWLRFRNAWILPSNLGAILPLFSWTRKMRRDNGVDYKLPTAPKPDYLILINSFFGLEIPRDLPPLCAAVGPILSDEYPPLDATTSHFLQKHTKTIYVALGTHVILTHADTVKVANGLFALIEDGAIDGIIWAVGESGRQDMDLNHTFTLANGSAIQLGDMLAGKVPHWQFPYFTPQRALLEHPSVCLYLTHGGGSSANEGLFHGKRMLAMGIFGDQIANTTRLVAAGVAESLNKFRFTADELRAKAMLILRDEHGTYARNVTRMQHIARVASRRKEHAADLIEEIMYDTEMRLDEGHELRPMHLQTADMRMSRFKKNNWDMLTVAAAVVGGMGGAAYILGRLAWTNRRLIQPSAWSLVGR